MLRKTTLFVILILAFYLTACEEQHDVYEHEHHSREYYNLIYYNDYYSIYTDGDYSSGDSCKFKIQHNFSQESLEFNGIFPENPDSTFITEVDITGDNIKDILIQLSTVYKTDDDNSIKRDLYAFDGKRRTQIDVGNIEEYVQSITSFNADADNYYVKINDKNYVVEKSAFSFISSEDFAEELRFGGLQNWYVDRENRLYYTMHCIITNPDANEQKEAGAISVYVTYDNRRMKVEKVKFSPSHYNEKIIDFETNSDDWKLWYNTNYLVLESTDGKRFHFGYTVGDEGIKYNIPDENRIQFFPNEDYDAKAFINDNFAAIIYDSVTFSADEPKADKVIIVDLTTGLMVEHLTVTANEILAHNNVDISVLDDYKYTTLTPIQYYITADVDIQGSGFVCAFKLESFDGKINYEYSVTYNTKEAQ